jgi:hypothetical protein
MTQQQFSSTAMTYGPMIVTPSPLVSGEEGIPYNVSLNASGGQAPYTWAITSGLLPAGLSLLPAGVISGTPTALFSGAVTIGLVDANGSPTSKPFGITVVSQLQITTPSLPTGTAGSPYSYPMAASGGAGNNQWSIVSQSGTYNTYVINPTSGVVTSAALNAGADTMVIKVVDALGAPATGNFTATIEPVATVAYLGMNTTPQTYSSSPMFLDVIKQATSNQFGSPWSNSANTGPDFATDSDGYVTSLTGLSGTVYSYAGFDIFYGIDSGAAGTPPNQTSVYPPGPYTYMGTGDFKLTISGDVTAISTSTPATVSISGLVATFTGAGVLQLTNNSPSNAGMRFNFSNYGAVYPQAMHLYQTASQIAFANGQVLHPLYVSFLVSCADRWRDMKAKNTNAQVMAITFTAAPAAGTNVAATIANMYCNQSGAYNAGAFSTWQLPSGTYQICLPDGTVSSATAIYQSATVTLATVDAAQTSGACFVLLQPAWANRPLPSNFSWSTYKGMPLEVIIGACNQNGIDPWHCLPCNANNTYITNTAQMFYSGTGSTLAAANSGLATARKLHVELDNETWNTLYFGSQYAGVQGNLAFPSGTANQANWIGMRVANIGDLFAAVYGSAMGTRCIVSMGSQFAWTAAQGAASNGIYYTNMKMNTPDWTSQAWTHNIGAIHFAPYIQFGGINASDITKLLASTNPLNSWFDLAYAQTDRYGTTFASMASNGWLGSTIATATGLIAGLTGYPWSPNGGASKVQVLGYESGTQWQNQTAAFQAFLYTALRDPRMQYVYNDPTHVLSSYPGYYPSMILAGFTNLNHFADTGYLVSGSTCVTMESTTQPISGAGTPPILLGLQSYAA